MKNYTRLGSAEREEISRMLAQHYSLNDIALVLGRHVSTISREIRTGSGNQSAYRAIRAQRRADRNAKKRRQGRRKLIEQSALQQYLYRKLRLKWSPEQIAKELKKGLSSGYSYAPCPGNSLHLSLCLAERRS